MLQTVALLHLSLSGLALHSADRLRAYWRTRDFGFEFQKRSQLSSARTSTSLVVVVAVPAFRLTSWIETCTEQRDRAQQAELRIACFSDNPTKVKNPSVG